MKHKNKTAKKNNVKQTVTSADTPRKKQDVKAKGNRGKTAAANENDTSKMNRGAKNSEDGKEHDIMDTLGNGHNPRSKPNRKPKAKLDKKYDVMQSKSNKRNSKAY